MTESGRTWAGRIYVPCYTGGIDLDLSVEALRTVHLASPVMSVLQVRLLSTMFS